MWLAWDLVYTNLPDPVFLKRFAAPRFVFILGITFSLTHFQPETVPAFKQYNEGNYSGVRIQEPESGIEAVYASGNLPTIQKFEVPKVGSELKLRGKNFKL